MIVYCQDFFWHPPVMQVFCMIDNKIDRFSSFFMGQIFFHQF